MNILLIDVDSKIPNIPIMKLSTYHKNNNDNIEFKQLNIQYYPSRKNKIQYIKTENYDIVYCSIVFNNTLKYLRFSNINNVIIGGTGYSLKIKLPEYIENLYPDYSLYPNNDTSYGFITRGCIRNCYFCVVPKKEGKLHKVNNISDILYHKKIKFLDNNILAYKNHYEILNELIDKNIKCNFNQGLDIRLLNEKNSYLLSKLNYMGEYVFAFDDWSYIKTIESKLKLLYWRKPWQIKFFVYCDKNMELKNIINRINWLKENKCLPYIMRNLNCWDSINKEFYIDIAAWCNQPAFFKKMTFEKFLNERHTKKDRIENSLKLYNK